MIERFLVPPGWTRIGEEAFHRSRRRISPLGPVVAVAAVVGIERLIGRDQDFPSLIWSALLLVVGILAVSVLLNVAFLLLLPGLRVATDGSALKSGWTTQSADALRAAVLQTPPAASVLMLGRYPGGGPRVLLKTNDHVMLTTTEQEVLIRLLERSDIQPPDIVRAEQPRGVRRDVRGLVSKERAIAAVRDLHPPVIDSAGAGPSPSP